MRMQERLAAYAHAYVCLRACELEHSLEGNVSQQAVV